MSGSFLDDLRDIPGFNEFPAPKARGLGIDERGDEGDVETDNEPKKDERPTFPCESCGGTGFYRGVRIHQEKEQCFACKGRGFYYMSRKDRELARAKRRASKAKRADDAAAEWAKAFPAEAAWIAARKESFGFASAMAEAVRKFGSLTENQAAAVRRMIEQDANREAERAAAKVRAIADAPVIDTAAVDRLKASLVQAGAKGLKHPALIFEGFTVTMAGANSKNAGGLYLKNGGEYLGKIVDGKLFATWEAKAVDGLLGRIEAAMVDPVAAARAYGKRTGRCSCCNRPLTDPVSVANGIGPICESKYF